MKKNFFKFIAKLNFLRLILIPILKKFNFEFKWKHDVTKRPFYLMSFYHKGYWYYGREREKKELDLIKKLISEGDFILEVGAHIGYLTQYFEYLVGHTGSVIAVEPTPYSLYFLKKNILPNTIVVEKAASNIIGEVDFFTENFGGFTNSLEENFTISQNKKNKKFNYVDSVLTSIKCKVDTLDNICRLNNFVPNFIKIDVEGSEYKVLLGAKKILAKANALMVEVSNNENEVFDLLSNFGFKRINISKNSKNFFFVRMSNFKESILL